MSVLPLLHSARVCAPLRDFAQSRGCTGMWVPTDADNEPAIAMYRSTRPDEDAPTRILWWDLSTEE